MGESFSRNGLTKDRQVRYGKSKAQSIMAWAGDRNCLFKSFCSNKRYRSLYFRGLGLQIKDFCRKEIFGHGSL